MPPVNLEASSNFPSYAGILPTKHGTSNPWVWGFIALFISLEIATLQFQHLKWIVFSILLMAFGLVTIVLALRLGSKLVLAFPLYVIIAMQFPVQMYLGFSISRWLSISLIAIIPIIFAVCKAGHPRIIVPAKSSLSLLSIAFVVSWLYQASNGNTFAFGQTALYDVYFAAGIFVFYAFFFLLSGTVINLALTFRTLAFAGIPFILIVLIEYQKTSGIGAIFHERLGISTRFNPNIISSYLELLLPLSLFLGMSEVKRSRRLLFLGISALYALSIIACYSRGSIPGLFCLCIFSIASIRIFKIRILIIVIMIGVLAVFGFGYLHRVFHPERSDLLSDAGRVELFQAALKILKENHYFFGIGMNNFSLAKFQHGFPSGFDPAQVMSSHNQYLELWLGWGLPALLGWMMLVLGTMWRLVKMRLPRGESLLRSGLFFSLLFFITHGAVDSVIGSPEIMFIVFLVLSCSQYLLFCNSSDSLDKTVEN